jgi:rhamnosyltransferase
LEGFCYANQEMNSTIPTISIVIRTLNEAASLEALFKSIRSQQGFSLEQIEIIVVDNQSTDNTPAVVRKYNAKLITLNRSEFTYPKSMNAGVKAATAPLIVLTVGHAKLISPTWLIDGVRHFTSSKVAGVYGPCIPLRQHSWAEWLLYVPGYWLARLRGPHSVRNRSGIMGATNCILRKALWNQHPFDQSYELGGEDGEWARWVLAKGFKIICDTAFSVRHSHHLGFVGVIKQISYWNKLKHPTSFNREALDHRQDINWN